MTFQNPPLPYRVDALEPHLSQQVVYYHYAKRTEKYYKVASELAKGTIYEGQDLEKLLTKEGLSKSESKLFVNASQAWNHTFYWASMTPKSSETTRSDDFERALSESFGSFDDFVKAFKEKADSAVGSAWTWLIKRPTGLIVKNIPNAGSPLTEDGSIPLLTMDIWEHAFELQYPADRKEYVEAFFKVIDWDTVSKRYEDAVK